MSVLLDRFAKEEDHALQQQCLSRVIDRKQALRQATVQEMKGGQGPTLPTESGDQLIASVAAVEPATLLGTTIVGVFEATDLEAVNMPELLSKLNQLIKARADVNCTGTGGCTALHHASAGINWLPTVVGAPFVKLLLNAGSCIPI